MKRCISIKCVNRPWCRVEDRGAEIGDVVTIDFTVFDESGTEITNAATEDLVMDMEEKDFIPELIQGLVGIKLDETREIKLTVPEGYLAEQYRR
jgi:trigger factor